uniref:Uncharacterized protein n=1 Tax=Anguilla anguilla TaxID=7936 RepID=A0A0E9Q829_ANGAN
MILFQAEILYFLF